MNFTGGLVLFVTIWFMVFLMVLPVRFVSQRDAGEVVPGTPASAPAEAHIARKAKITTGIAIVLWGVIAFTILYGGFTIRDLDWFNRLPPETQAS
jgi:predicted secreted protein